MERVAFLIEESGQQLDCLLNPETLVMRRLAGLQPRRSATGTLTGRGLTDDPMLFTGGGRTELTLDLLFDVSLAGFSMPTDDVRSRTRPLWDLAENRSMGSSRRSPSRVRFIWGKSWNIPCVVLAVAERLEQFTEGGTPRRSWLRLRLLRVEDDQRNRTDRRSFTASLPTEEQALAAPQVGAHSVIGGNPPLAEPDEIDLLPLPEVEVTISESIVTAAALVADAFHETPAGQLLADLQNGIGDSIHHAAAAFEQGASDLAEEIGDALGDSELLQDLKTAFDAVAIKLEIAGAAIGDALASAKMSVIEVTMDSVGTLSVAIRQVEATINRIAREIGEEVDAAIFAPIRAALEPYRPLIDAMMTSAALVGGAVKERAARVAAVTVRTLEAGAKSAAAFLEALNSGEVSIAGEVREMVTPALDTIESIVTSIRKTGEALILEDLPELMLRIERGVLRLRETGENMLADQLEETANTLSLGVDGLDSVANARAEVGHSKSVERVAESLNQIETMLNKAEGDTTARSEAILASLTRVQQISALIEESEQKSVVSALPDEIEQIEATVVQSIAGKKALTAAQKKKIRGSLKRINSVMAAVLAHEKETNASAILSAIEEAEAEGSDSPSEPTPDDLGVEEERSQGERLDQLAYHYLGDPAAWRLLALYNGIDHPLKLPTGLLLRLPSGDRI